MLFSFVLLPDVEGKGAPFMTSEGDTSTGLIQSSRGARSPGRLKGMFLCRRGQHLSAWSNEMKKEKLSHCRADLAEKRKIDLHDFKRAQGAQHTGTQVSRMLQLKNLVFTLFI